MKPKITNYLSKIACRESRPGSAIAPLPWWAAELSATPGGPTWSEDDFLRNTVGISLPQTCRVPAFGAGSVLDW